MKTCLLNFLLMTSLSVTAADCLAAAPEPSRPKPAPKACALSAADAAWLGQSLQAWRFASTQLIDTLAIKPVSVVIFDRSCALTSQNALSAQSTPKWRAAKHRGSIALPDGQTMPAGVASFAGEARNAPFFAMSTPSLWRANEVPGDDIGLEKLMTAVWLHEASHVAQQPYMQEFGALAERLKLPETFDDDSLQRQFRSNAAFSDSVARETDLLFEAAAAADPAAARQLAGEARELMRIRRATWYTGEQADFARIEDIWLTMEGAGQWLGYQWLTSANGGQMDASRMIEAFGRRGGWWSQTEGLALALVTDRLSQGAWKKTVYGDGSANLLELLDQALATDSSLDKVQQEPR